MFSKIRKHLNIMCLLLILLIAILCIVLMGVYSIDDYCQDYIISKIEAEDMLIDNNIDCMMSNAENLLSMVEVCLSSNSDISAVLNKIKTTKFAKSNSNLSNVYVIDNNMLYNMMENKSYNAKEAKDTEWYQKAIDSEEIYVSNCFEDFNTGEKCVAICKRSNSNKTIIAVCVRISNLLNSLKLEDIEGAYIINQNNVIIASTTETYTNINVMDDHKQLPEGHRDVFKNINIIDGTEEINTSGGRLLVSCTKSVENIKNIIIRDKTILIQEINNIYLEVLAMLVAALLLIVGLCVVATVYTRKVKNVNYSKCEFIEGMAAEIKIPLDSINYFGKTVLKDVEDENIIQGVNSILENSQSIAFVLNNAYDYSKIAINDFKIVNNKYSIKNVIRNVEKVVRCDVQKNNVYFDSYIVGNDSLLLYGDQRKLEELIINLVKIAAHHTIQGGIELKVMYADLTVDRVNIMLIVQDSGVGMTDNDLSDYAEELNNVPVSLEVGDTGSGINMVKQIVKILNGKIVVDSTKNVGTIYTVMIPQKILTTDDTKWENEKVKSSVELMNEFSYIKDKDKIAQYTTQIERKQTTSVERREIKKNEIDYNIEQSSISLDNFEDSNNNVLDELLSDSSNEDDARLVGTEYKNNNVEYVPEPIVDNNQQETFGNQKDIDNNIDSVIQFNEERLEKVESLEKNSMNLVKDDKVENERSEDNENDSKEDDTIYDVPMPENQVDFLMNKNMDIIEKSEEQEAFEKEEQEEFEIEEEEEQEEFEIEEEEEEQEEFDIESEENEEQIEEIELRKNIEYISKFLSEFGVDGSQILEEYDNDVEEYKKALIRFYEYSKEGANRIIGLWNSKKIQEYFSAIDVVNEGAKRIGASRVSDIIQKQLEKGEEGDLKFVAQTVKDLFSEWKLLLNAIVQYLQNIR